MQIAKGDRKLAKCVERREKKEWEAAHPFRVETLYHGTSWNIAAGIMTQGFIPSTAGRLGQGIYVAEYDKARRFAQDKSWHGGAGGCALLEVKITFRNPKYVKSDDDTWQRQGFDACRADRTSMSRNMEWCVKNKSQVTVMGVERVT